MIKKNAIVVVETIDFQLNDFNFFLLFSHRGKKGSKKALGPMQAVRRSKTNRAKWRKSGKVFPNDKHFLTFA